MVKITRNDNDYKTKMITFIDYCVPGIVRSTLH